MNTLEIRETHTYVGTYSHLDKWRDIGTYEILRTRDLTDYNPPGYDALTEPMLQEHMIFVHRMMGVTDEEVAQALCDQFNKHGCAHEYDCCGCRSYSVDTCSAVTGDLWRVTVGSSRNY